MECAPYPRRIHGVGESKSKDTKEPKMFTSPETALTLAKLHQKELIAEAERSRLLASARRSRKSRASRIQN
jgi:hypothetical protein